MKTTYTIALAPEINAKIIIEGIGQQKPVNGDNVIVRVTLYLPRDNGGECHFLDERIIFGERCPQVFGEFLFVTWGVCKEDGMKKSEIFFAPTWKEAAAQAAEYVREQLLPLQEALAARAKALEDAGEWV